jgi:transcriptional regulator with XRE-family HTH domain
MSTAVLAPVEDREVVTCDHCALVQYRTTNGFCRRCHKVSSRPEPSEPEKKLITLPPPIVRKVKIILESEPTAPTPELSFSASLPGIIRKLRESRGMGQTELAKQAGFVRTYIAKIEGGKARPQFLNLQLCARGLGTRGSSLAMLIENPEARIARPLKSLDKTILKHVGSTFRKLRQASGKNRAEFISAMGINSGCYLSSVENGGKIPHLSFFVQLARVINKPVSFVIAEIENAASMES